MKMHRLLASAAVTAVITASASHAATYTEVKEQYVEVEHAELVPYNSGDNYSYAPSSSVNSSGAYFLGFEGMNQYDVGSYGRGFIPPDTMGAVGRDQYTVMVNGGFGVFDKSTGAAILKQSDLDFWARVGQTGANGDSRIMFNSDTNRWVALSFGSSVGDIQIAVSDSSDATGTWKSTKFTGFDGGGPGSVADYPTMALDSHALYIGTNDFGDSGPCPYGICGTTLNVLPLDSLFAAGGPTTTNLVQFYQAVDFATDRGFAIQGVNTDSANPNGKLIADSLYNYDTKVTYEVTFDSNGVATGLTPVENLNVQTTAHDNGPGRQPNAVPDIGANADFANNNRVIDTLDERISAAVFEQNGLVYSVYTNTVPGTDFTSVHYLVTDAATNAILDEGNIGDGQHDFYQGSIAVNANGQVMIAYNRSGSEKTDANGDGLSDGNITFAAEVFSTGSDGKLTLRSGELVLKVSLVDDYHNGSIDGQVARGRQRWGDYSAVNLDPNDSNVFWAIGEYAREYNDAAGGHPGGTGGSRWSTWVAGINVSEFAVPEPSTWAMMILGLGFVGAAMRRKRVSVRYAVS